MTLALGGTMASYPALADLSTRQYTFVTQDTNGRVGDGSAGDACVGILQNKPTAIDRSATVQIDGISKLRVAGTTSQGDRLKMDNDGLGVVTTTATDKVGAIAEEDGGADDIIAVRVVPYAFGA